MNQTARFRETLRRLAMIDEGFVEDDAGLGLNQASVSALDPRTVAVLQLGASVAIGSPAACLEWSTTQALAAGASEDEIAGVLLAIAPVVGLGRIVCAAPGMAAALGYDVAAALEEPDEPIGCGDDPNRNYREVSAKLRLIRGPYPQAIGVLAYAKHLQSHGQTDADAPAASGNPRPASWKE